MDEIVLTEAKCKSCGCKFKYITFMGVEKSDKICYRCDKELVQLDQTIIKEDN